MNELNVPLAKITCNPGYPLRAAQLHNFALRLDLRRLRRSLVGGGRIVAVDRLLAVDAAVACSLEWPSGKTETVPGDYGALDPLAIESEATAEAVSQ
jgi:hypothetical protein